jgi:ComF family protein
MRSGGTARSRSVSASQTLGIDLEPRRRLAWAGRAALDLLLPPQCVLCDASVQDQGQLCPACFGRTSLISEPYCLRCGVPFVVAEQGGEEQSCLACRERPPVFGQARAALRYDAQGRQLILPFKHANRTELASVLAPLMARAGAGLLLQADLLVPVPLHRWRLFHRGYNQAALLVQALGRLSAHSVVLDGLRRVRPTAPLGDQTADARAAAVAGVFAVHPRRLSVLAGRRLLLVDDVMTSGATASACAAVLLDAGAASVDVLVAARVPDPRLR